MQRGSLPFWQSVDLMHVTSAKTTPIDIRLSSSVQTGAGSIGDRGGVRVTIEADGDTGVGETAAIPGQPGPGLEQLATETSQWCQSAQSAPVSDLIEGLDSAGLSPISRFAVHTALIDLQSRQADLSTSQWLSPGAATRVSVNGMISEVNPAAVHERARDLVDQNVSAIKLKVGSQDPGQDITRIVAASEAAGSSAELRLDANGAWTAEIAIRVIGRVGKHRISYIEDPTTDPSEFARIADECEVDVAIDLDAMTDPTEAIEAAGVRTVVVKPAAVGGIDRVLQLVEKYHDHRFIVSSSIQRQVGLAAAVHAAALIHTTNPGPHGLATGRLIHQMDQTLLDAHGQVRVPAGPGIWNEVPSTEPADPIPVSR